MKKILMPLILCSSISLMAQHTISGQVLDELSQTPLRNVTIALKIAIPQ